MPRALLAAAVLCGAAYAQARTGGVLHVAQRAEPKTFNPVAAVDAPSRDVLRRIHGDLISLDRSTMRTAPGLAESWKTSADGRVISLRLRPNVKFSDGHPFASDDVAFTFAAHLDPAVASAQRDLLVLHGKPIVVRTKGPLAVEVEFPEPYAAGDRLFDSIAILPRHRLEAAWKAGTLRQAWTLAAAPAEIAGLGPFRLKEYRAGEAVVLERNPYYWQKDRPYLDGIEFRLLPDEETQLAWFVSGRLDILNRLQPQAIGYLGSRHLPVSDSGPSLEYNFVCFNLSFSGTARPYHSTEFRKALSAAVDRRAMARVVYEGRAAPIWGPVSPGNELWFRAPQWSPNHAIADAKRRLSSAGFRWNAHTELVDAAGKPVEFTLLVSASSAERIRMANLVAADWKELGVKAQVVTLEFRSLLERVLNTRQFDAVLLGLGGGDADPNPEMNVWLSSGGMHLWNPNQAKPATAWEAELDRLMQDQMVTVDPARRRGLYHRALGIIEREQPMIFLVSPHVVTAQRGRVGNFRPARLDHYTLWNAAELYLGQDK
ncbi:MAG: ABC transporter substrate-binding protein [Bryobacteraceae bacterium]